MGRVSKKEMDNSVTSIKPNSKPSKSVAITLYDKVGNEQEFLPDDQIAAKTVHKEKNIDYYVKTNHIGNLVDYFDKDFVNEAYRLGRMNGRSPYEFKKVDSQVFNYYLKYLRSKDRMYLDQASRGY